MSRRKMKSGGALVIALLVLLSLSCITVGLFSLADHSGRETIVKKQSVQAFWLAESGVQQAVEKILTDAGYRSKVKTSAADADDPDGGPYQIAIGDGTAGTNNVTVWKDGNDYYVASWGSIGRMTRRLSVLVADVRSDLPYAVMALGGDTDLGKDSQIIGDLYTWGEVSLGKNASVSGSIYAKDYSGDFIELHSAVDLDFDDAYYQSELDYAANGGVPAGEWLDDDFKESNLNLTDYADNTLWVNGNVEIKEEITGPGTLYINGDITFKKDYEIDDNVTIILSGNVDAKKEGVIGTNINVFATGNGEFYKATQASSGASSLVFVGNYKAHKELSFTGLIYAGGNVDFKKSAEVEGAVVSGGNLTLSKDSVLTYNPKMIPSWVMVSMINVERCTSENTWDEPASY